MPRGGKRANAGRPAGSGAGDGFGTIRTRHSSEISKEQIDSIPEVLDLLRHWAERCDGSPRYYYLEQALNEILATGIDPRSTPR